MKSTSGFTLIEMLISFAILALIAGVFVVFQNDLFSLNRFLEQSLSIQRDSETVIRELVAELRSASLANTGAYPLEITASTSLSFYTDIDRDIVRERVHYFLDGKNLKKSVVEPAGTPLTYSTTTAQETVRVVLRDIDTSTTTPLFAYYDATYTGTSSPLFQPVNPASVRLVSISITVDADPLRSPPPITVSSQVTIRSLKFNP